jgi:Calcineurin-like phosphoesterase
VPQTVRGESYKIVISGDGRAEYPWNDKRCVDYDGINTVVATAICKAVLAEHANTLLWTGDIANINDRNGETLERRLQTWRNIMQPLYDAGINVWPVRGNHEVYRYVDGSYDGEPIPDAKKAWDTVFSGRYALPANGPPDEINLSFFSVSKSILIVGLDQYGTVDADILCRRHAVKQEWLEQVLKDQKRPFMFMYGHEPAFMAGRHEDDDTLAADSCGRNAFWRSLVNAGVQVYFCGHDHFYDRMSVARNDVDHGRIVFQITAGTAGAPFYTASHYSGATQWTLQRLKHIEQAYGYILVEVDDKKATISFKASDAAGECLNFVLKDQIICDATGCK